MQIVFPERGDILPRVSAELRRPIRRRLPLLAVLPDVVVHVVGIACKRAFEPLVFGRCMVEYHIKHKTNAACLCRADERIHILHRAEARIDGAVVGDVIAAVVLRRGEKRREPEEVDAQLLQVAELCGDALQVAEPIPVRVVEGFRIDLIDDFVLYVHLMASLLRRDDDGLSCLGTDSRVIFDGLRRAL